MERLIDAKTQNTIRQGCRKGIINLIKSAKNEFDNEKNIENLDIFNNNGGTNNSSIKKGKKLKGLNRDKKRREKIINMMMLINCREYALEVILRNIMRLASVVHATLIAILVKRS